MKLDINTPRGQVTLEQEKRAAAIYEQAAARHGVTIRYVHTDKAKDAKIDGLLIRDQCRLTRIALTSCRNMSRDTLRGLFDNEWLITWRKVALAAQLSKLLRTPLVGFLYLVPDDLLLVREFYDGQRWSVPLRTALTETQATVNGGSVVRRNAYVRMDEAMPMQWEA